jgi:Glycosyltransferase family 9 (heptosyltransferase)
MGYGDDIMATAEAREARLRHPGSKILMGDGEREFFSPVYQNNPNIDRLAQVSSADKVHWVKNYPGRRPYYDPVKSTTEKLAFTDFTAVPGDLYFSRFETWWASLRVGHMRDFIVVEPLIKGSFSANNKDWGFEKWQQVAHELSRKHPLVQLGSWKGRGLEGVQRIPTFSFRSATAILAQSRLFIGTDGGLHHAAAALRIPAVVIFGGRVSPKNLGYRSHVNLYVETPESPCGWNTPCAHCRACMESITVTQVLDAVELAPDRAAGAHS